jgi:predicted neuraminidase
MDLTSTDDLPPSNMDPRMLTLLFFLVTTLSQSSTIEERLIFPLQNFHVHSSCIIQAPNGDLLACWFEGSGERQATDVAIKGSRLRKGESRWSEPFLMADTPDFPDLNPILLIDDHQELVLFWIVVPSERWEDSLLKVRRSKDYLGEGAPQWYWQDLLLLKPAEDFADWVAKGLTGVDAEGLDYGGYAASPIQSLATAAEDLSKQQRGWMPRNHVLRLPSGRLLMPLYSDGFYVGLMGISDDGGKTWRAGSPIPGVALNQPSVVQRRDGTLVAYMRREGNIPPLRVPVSISKDQGETWSVAETSDIPNPNSSLEVIALQDGRWVMIYNDQERGRDRLALAMSDDEGITWKWKRLLEEIPGGKFHYPSIMQSQDGRIHATYTYQPGADAKKTIKHVSLDSAWISSQDN